MRGSAMRISSDSLPSERRLQRSHATSWVLLLLAYFSLSLRICQAQGGPQTQQIASNKEDGIRWVMKQYPSVRFGNVLRVDFRARFQADLRTFSPDSKPDESSFTLHRARLGIQGTFLKRFEYEVERDFQDSDHPWRDIALNYRAHRRFEIQGGRFKVPFGLDQLTRITDFDYVFRSRVGETVAPGRDTGLMAHGRFFKRGLNYQVGAFLHDGDNAGRGQRTLAARFTGTPLRLFPAPRWLKGLRAGFAVAHSELPEGLNSLRGRTLSRETFFNRVFVSGRRVRLGVELDWSSGPFSVKGEYLQSSDTRHGQGVRTQDLPSLLARGWYLSGTWVVTGEKKAGGLEPRRAFLRDGGWGAVEVAVRCEKLQLGSSSYPGPALVHPRAANLLGNGQQIWTFGLNWHLNRHTKIQANAVREDLEDILRSPVPGQKLFWGQVVRLQVAF
jgi:phosphate-selective porin OprO and OprP